MTMSTLRRLRLLVMVVYAGTGFSLSACLSMISQNGGTPETAVFGDNARTAVAIDGKSQCIQYDGERVYAAQYTAQRQWLINVYKASQSPNAPPICSATTTLRGVGGIADDTSGKLWVMDSTAVALDVYPHAAEGTVAPIQSISGSRTKLCGLETSLQGIAEDSSGNIWVPCWYDYNGPYGYLVAFANDANGNVAPTASIGFRDKGRGEGIEAPVAVGFDADGNLYIAEFTHTPEVVVFSPPFKDDSRPVATWTIQGQYSSAQFVSSDESGVFIGGQKEYVFYKGGLRSNGIPQRLVFIPQGAYDVKLDAQARMFVAQTGPCDSNGTIAVLPPHAKTYDKYRCLGDSDGTGSLAVGP